MKAYIATTLTNTHQHNAIRDYLVNHHNIQLTYDWTPHGPVWSDGERRVREVSILEAEGVERADIVVVALPGGRGTHAELGMAIALRKPIFIISSVRPDHLQINDQTCAFYHHPMVVARCECFTDFVDAVRAYLADSLQSASFVR